MCIFPRKDRSECYGIVVGWTWEEEETVSLKPTKARGSKSFVLFKARNNYKEAESRKLPWKVQSVAQIRETLGLPALEDDRKDSSGPWVLRVQAMASYPLPLPMRMAKAEQAPMMAVTEQLAMAPMDVSRIRLCHTPAILPFILFFEHQVYSFMFRQLD